MVKRSKTERISYEMVAQINYLVKKGYTRVGATRVIAKTFKKIVMSKTK